MAPWWSDRGGKDMCLPCYRAHCLELRTPDPPPPAVAPLPRQPTRRRAEATARAGMVQLDWLDGYSDNRPAPSGRYRPEPKRTTVSRARQEVADPANPLRREPGRCGVRGWDAQGTWYLECPNQHPCPVHPIPF